MYLEAVNLRQRVDNFVQKAHKYSFKVCVWLLYAMCSRLEVVYSMTLTEDAYVVSCNIYSSLRPSVVT